MAIVTVYHPQLFVTMHFPQNHYLTAKTMLSQSLTQLSKSSKPLNPNAEPFDMEHRRVPEKKRSNYGHNNHHKAPSRREWRVKCDKRNLPENKTTPNYSSIIPFPKTIEEANTSVTTTVMIRNIPNQYKLEDLLRILDEHCLQQNKSDDDDPANRSKFDFVYLPMDYRKHAIEGKMSNLGYAFVNFTTPSAAFKFYEQFHRFEWNVKENRKTCEINAAQYQGKENLVRIFSQKVFRCKSRDFLPVKFSEARDGIGLNSNPQMKGTPVGKYVWGLPTRSIGTRASFQN
ncbi:RNA-binding domain superfamily [Sesbania bispinosa]|nr:RNA-binding domain superfamily [Sesbania bispinosa]